MKKIVLLASVASILGSVSAPAFAEETKAETDFPHRFIVKMDTDGDGVVSGEEYRAHVSEIADRRFEKLDANGDGKLSSDEFKAPKRGKDKKRERLGADKSAN